MDKSPNTQRTPSPTGELTIMLPEEVVATTPAPPYASVAVPGPASCAFTNTSSAPTTYKTVAAALAAQRKEAAAARWRTPERWTTHASTTASTATTSTAATNTTTSTTSTTTTSTAATTSTTSTTSDSAGYSHQGGDGEEGADTSAPYVNVMGVIDIFHPEVGKWYAV